MQRVVRRILRKEYAPYLEGMRSKQCEKFSVCRGNAGAVMMLIKAAEVFPDLGEECIKAAL